MVSTLVVEGLSKRYASALALDGLDFRVDKGEVFALLGPNGAGKTTTLEIIEGIRRADGGSVLVSGIDAFERRDAALARVGIQLQTQGLPPALSPRRALEFFSAYRRRAPRPGILERFGLGPYLDRPTRELSTGWQRRLALALALAHGPELLVLDEPTAGLDVESRNVLHEAIREERARGVSVLLASHDMAEVEKLADRALVLVKGREAARGSPRELTSCGDSATRVALRTREGSLAARLSELPGLTAPARLDREGYVHAKVRDAAPLLSWLLREVEKGGDEIVDLRVERPSLEERFLELAGGAA